MGERDLAALREVNVSMGIMLESTSERLLAPGAAHDRAPDKVPAPAPAHHRARPASSASPSPPASSSASARRSKSGSTSLLAIRDLHERYGHIQEVIVQNFRAKPAIPHARGARSRRSTICYARSRSPASCSGRDDEHPGAAQPVAGDLPRLAAARAQRLGRHLAAHPRSHQPRGPWPVLARCATPPSRRATSCASGWRSIPSTSSTRAEFLDARPATARRGARRRRRPGEARARTMETLVSLDTRTRPGFLDVARPRRASTAASCRSTTARCSAGATGATCTR